MSRPLLKRRLNPFLIASTILVLSLLAGLSVMWQGQLSNIQGDKTDLQDRVEEQEQRISQLQAENSNMSEELETTSSSLGSLQSQYSQLETEVSSLESTVQDKNNEIQDLESEKDELEKTVENINSSFEIVCTHDNTSMDYAAEYQCEEWGHEP